MVIQIARATGARVFASGSTGDQARIERLGATFVDREATLAELGQLTTQRGFDVVYNTIGGTALDEAFSVVCRFGHVVSSLGWGTHALAPLSFRAATYAGVFTLLPLLTGEGCTHHGQILEQASRLVDSGQLV